MLENATTHDPNFALAYAAIATVCAYYHTHFTQDGVWMQRARAAAQRAVKLQPEAPEVMLAQAWILLAESRYDEVTAIVRNVVARIPDCEGAYYLLVRTLFASGQFQEVAIVAERAIEASGNDYNIYVPI